MPDIQLVIQLLNIGGLAFVVYALAVQEWLVPGRIHRRMVETLREDYTTLREEFNTALIRINETYEKQLQDIKDTAIATAASICNDREDDFKELIADAVSLAVTQVSKQSKANQELIKAVNDIKHAIGELSITNPDKAVTRALERALAGLAIKSVENDGTDYSDNYKKLVSQLKSVLDEFENASNGN